MSRNRTSSTTSRRGFLRGLAASGLAVGAAPLIVPSRALGAVAAAPASDRITLALIGAGGMGNAHLGGLIPNRSVQLLAVCDVRRANAEAAKARIEEGYGDAMRSGQYKGCAVYNDYREVLARDDIDAVFVATPDHWHALIVCDAVAAGKDVYGEKPLSYCIGEGRKMVEAVDSYGRVFQTGSQQRSSHPFRHAAELVRNGRLGSIHRIDVGLHANPVIGPQAVVPVPEGFDYDMWLGPAPTAPYCPERCNFNFRWNFDYSGGSLTDWGAHHCDIVQWALDRDRSGPVEYEGTATWPAEGLYNVPTHYEVTATYEDGIRMIISSDFENGIKFYGERGWLFVSRSRMDAEPKNILRETIGPDEIRLYRSDNHHGNFFECMRTRREPIAPIEVAHRSITIAHLGNIALRLGRKVRWNPATERFVNDPVAERCLWRPMRSPWRL